MTCVQTGLSLWRHHTPLQLLPKSNFPLRRTCVRHKPRSFVLHKPGCSLPGIHACASLILSWLNNWHHFDSQVWYRGRRVMLYDTIKTTIWNYFKVRQEIKALQLLLFFLAELKLPFNAPTIWRPSRTITTTPKQEFKTWLQLNSLMPLNGSLSDLTCFPMVALVCVSARWINTTLTQSVTARQPALYFPLRWNRQETGGWRCFCLHVLHTPLHRGVCAHTHTSLTYTRLPICRTGSHRSMQSSCEEHLTLRVTGNKWGRLL